MKIMLIGADGQLGSDLLPALSPDTVVPLRQADIEITDPDSVRRAFARCRPEVVINTAAFHRVDECEQEIEMTFRVNTFAVRDLALRCREYQARLVHFSTDYVFSGEKRAPYLETDLPGPLNVYGVSKLAGEYLVGAILPQHYLIRTCGLYGHRGSLVKGGNFVETMLRRAAEGKALRVVHDQVVAPTYTVDLARKVSGLIRTEAYGLYHITNRGACSWYEFARRIFELTGMRADLSPTTSQEYQTAARRPAYSVLRNYHLEQLGQDDLPTWDDALQRFLREENKLADSKASRAA